MTFPLPTLRPELSFGCRSTGPTHLRGGMTGHHSNHLTVGRRGHVPQNDRRATVENQIRIFCVIELKNTPKMFQNNIEVLKVNRFLV